MALNATELVTVAEITQELLGTVESYAGSLTAEQVTSIQADVVLWNENRNDVDVWLTDADGVSWEAQKLLDAIRARVRRQLGLSLYSSETHPTSGAICNGFVF